MAEFPVCAHDALALDGLLTPDERAVRAKVRAFMVRAPGRGGGGGWTSAAEQGPRGGVAASQRDPLARRG
jgi:hypothetical protein